MSIYNDTTIAVRLQPLKEIVEDARKVLAGGKEYQPPNKAVYNLDELQGDGMLTEFEEWLDAFLGNALNGRYRANLPLVRLLQEKGADTIVAADYVGDVGEFQEPDWLVPGVIVREGLTLLYGDAGVGKTTFALELTDSLQEGKPFLGMLVSKGKVLFIEQDEGVSMLKSHWEKMGKSTRLTVSKKDILWDAANKAFGKDFAITLQVAKPDVVFIDAYTSLGIPDITRPESALVLDELRRQARGYHTAIVLLHHTNQNGEQMGSSLHKAKVDCLLSVTQVHDQRLMLTQEKVRGSKFGPILLDFDRERLEMHVAEKTLKDQVKEMLESGIDKSKIEQQFPKTAHATVKRYLRELAKAVPKKG